MEEVLHRVVSGIDHEVGQDLLAIAENRSRLNIKERSRLFLILHNHMSLHHLDEKTNGDLKKFFRRKIVKFGEEQTERLLLLSYADRLDLFIGNINLNRIVILDSVHIKLLLIITKGNT